MSKSFALIVSIDSPDDIPGRLTEVAKMIQTDIDHKKLCRIFG